MHSMWYKKFNLSVPAYIAVLLISCVAGVSIADAASRFWRGGMNNSNQYENPMNWSATLGGDGNVAVPTSADNVYFMNNFSGATLIGKNVWIKSPAIVKGLVINQNMTGTILIGTGSLNVGADGIRMGSGRLIGNTGNISIAGGFVMTGGIVRLGAMNLSLSGSLAISKGVTSSYTQIVSTGSLVFSGRSADQDFVMGSGIVGSLKNLTLNNTAGGTDDDIIVNASYLALSGALTITRGNLDLAANNVILLADSGVTLAANAQATLTSDANITASGHIVAGAGAAFVLSTNTFTLNGVNQNLDTNNSPFYNLTIGSSGTATLTSDQSVTHTLQVNTGSTLNLNGFTLYATGATIINYGTITEGASKIVHNATVLITDSSYAEDNTLSVGTVYLSVADGDENIDGTTPDSFTATVTLSNGDSESVTLTESSNNSGVFRGSIPLTFGVNYVASDGGLEATETSTMTLSYTDAQDGETATDSGTYTASSSSSTSSSTTGGASGGRRGGGGGGSTMGSTSVTTQTSQSSAAAVGGDLPQVRGDLSVTIGGQSLVFHDVPVTQWFAPYVLSLVNAGIVSGYRDAQGELTGEFKPTNNVTYAELAKMAVEAAGLTARVDKTPQNRSARGQWSSGYIAALEERGVSVFSAPGLDVNTVASRGAVLQVIQEAFGRSIPDAQGGVYSDVTAQTVHAGAIESATSAGIVSGDDGTSTFRPTASINRAEVSKIIVKAMQTYRGQ
ncbi:MAG: S-layer homology domain-containing protein [Candidatus Peribacteraceae bacterium]|nr:S-layer homology domain-containing protein [Candidatus Peribacteraceae bacterium]